MPTEGPSIIQVIFPYAIIFGIFYFLVFRPQKQKQEQMKKLIASVKKNDEIVTNSGIHGTVVNVKETTVVVRIDDNARMEIDKEAIATVTAKT
jgi:preprotein translocase subunit YajC